MAGQARRGTRGHGRSSRDDSLPVLAAASAAVSGPATASTTSTPSTDPVSRTATRATYRMLLLRGLAPNEAANLTAYLCGIQVGSQAWRIDEVNRLLFLRELQLAGRFGFNDGATGSP